jgi:transcriptional regulator with XRE-family HTH domain
MPVVHSDYDLGQRIGIVLGRSRRLQNLTQTDLAARAGVTQAEISLIEKGGRLRLHTLQKVSGALGLGLGETIMYAEGFGDVPTVLAETREFVARVGGRLQAQKKKAVSKHDPKPRVPVAAP